MWNDTDIQRVSHLFKMKTSAFLDAYLVQDKAEQAKTDLKKISTSNANNLKLIALLRSNPRRLLATLLVSNNFIS